ncbi:MAG: N-acyl-D-amino-acid deacylase family protein [Ignavibacteriales bacterium]
MARDCSILVRNGRVVDGTGNPSGVMDVAILGDRIEYAGRSLNVKAERVIDASGLVVSPGFIDLHNHTDMAVLAYPRCESHIMQGITTSVTGNCGLAMAPVNPANLHLLQQYVAPFLPRGFDWGWDWRSVNDYHARIQENGISMNLAPLASQGAIRLAVKGFDDGRPSGEELGEMKRLLRETLESGAWGMSAGMIYPPGCYADTTELAELVKVVREYGGFYSTHIRNEGDRLMESVEEAMSIGERTGARVEISHHKALGRHNWGKVFATVREIEKARERGVDVSFDCYPYTACSTTLTACMPPWTMVGGVSAMLDRLGDRETRKRIAAEIAGNSAEMENMIKGSGWDGIFIAACPANHDYDGKSLEAILKETGRFNDPYEGFFDFLLEIRGEASMVAFAMDEADLRMLLTHPLSSIITDAWLTRADAPERPHPRSYGSFPRILGKYVREERTLTLEEAIRKMTSLPASVVGLQDRGIIREGLKADLVVFDPETVDEAATYEHPNRYPTGFHYIIVNGLITVEHGEHTGALNGRILRKGG